MRLSRTVFSGGVLFTTAETVSKIITPIYERQMNMTRLRELVFPWQWNSSKCCDRCLTEHGQNFWLPGSCEGSGPSTPESVEG